MTDLDDRFEAYIFAPKRERIVQKWRVIQCHFMALFSGNGIFLAMFAMLGYITHAIPVEGAKNLALRPTYTTITRPWKLFLI